MSDLDRYYTPVEVARRVVQSVEQVGDDARCVDPTCGSGNLLDACEDHFMASSCIGLDRDALTIRKLRRKRPHWTLSTADLLNARSVSSSTAGRRGSQIDLLVLNPPFSQASTKFVQVDFGGSALRASHAMACVLRSFDIFRPRWGAVAILPESALFSELDDQARIALGKNYPMQELFGLKSSTFRGARARTVAVRFAATADSFRSPEDTRLPKQVSVRLVRGSLPVHGATFRQKGIPFVHTTEIAKVRASGDRLLRRVRIDAAGRVSGWQVLLPRVGLPRFDNLQPLYLPEEVVLSDCVLAIGCSNRSVAIQVVQCLRENWDIFLLLYRGTGARYVTVARLRSWFGMYGIDLSD